MIMQSVPAVKATPKERTDRMRSAGYRSENLELWIGLGILGVIVMAVLGASFFAPVDPIKQDLRHTLESPSASHLLGTDHLGRDIFSRLLHGGQLDLGIALLSVVIPFLIGCILGAFAGYFGGWIDSVIMRIGDIVMVFPFYVLVIVLVFAIGGGPVSVIVAISAVSWVAYARVIRAETLVIREREYIDACRSSGLHTSRIILRHIVPNAAPQAVIFSMSDIVGNVGVIVTLSFFGLGIAPPTADWGRMISDGQQFLGAGRYDLVLVPACAVVLTSLALSLIGDGLARILRGER